MVQLNHDEEMGTVHAMCGSLSAEIEVQRSTKRAELTAFFRFLKGNSGPTTAHVCKGIMDGLWRREMKCIGQRAKDRLVDLDLGRVALTVNAFWWKPSTSKRIAPRRKVSKCLSLKSSSSKAMRRQTSWQRKKSDAGCERCGRGQSQHSLAEKRGGSRSVATCSQLSLSGGGIATKEVDLCDKS